MWMPTKNKPDNNREVLIYLTVGAIEIAYYDDARDRWRSSHFTGGYIDHQDISHWMELPERPY